MDERDGDWGRGERADGRVRIPADVDRPDTLLGGLTARQLAILAATAVVLWAGWAITRAWLPLPVFAAAGFPPAAVSVAVALGRRDGLPADRLLAAAIVQWRRPRRMVLAPDGVQPAPAWARAISSSSPTDHDHETRTGRAPRGQTGGAGLAPLPAPLRLPVGGVSADGIVDLGPDGAALICRASAVTFSLRTRAEQRALVDGFGRWLNSLDSPVQILARAIPVDLTPTIDRLLAGAPGLPDPGLEAAARDHAQFLTDLAAGTDLLAQQVLIILRQPTTPGHDLTGQDSAGLGSAGQDSAGRGSAGMDVAVRLRRRAEDATVALAAAGVGLTVLDGPAATACLNACLDPLAPTVSGGLAGPDDIITAATSATGAGDAFAAGGSGW